MLRAVRRGEKILGVVLTLNGAQLHNMIGFPAIFRLRSLRLLLRVSLLHSDLRAEHLGFMARS